LDLLKVLRLNLSKDIVDGLPIESSWCFVLHFNVFLLACISFRFFELRKLRRIVLGLALQKLLEVKEVFLGRTAFLGFNQISRHPIYLSIIRVWWDKQVQLVIICHCLSFVSVINLAFVVFDAAGAPDALDFFDIAKITKITNSVCSVCSSIAIQAEELLHDIVFDHNRIRVCYVTWSLCGLGRLAVRRLDGFWNR